MRTRREWEPWAFCLRRSGGKLTPVNVRGVDSAKLAGRFMTTAPIPRVRLLFGLVSLAGMLLPLPAPAAHDGVRLYAQHWEKDVRSILDQLTH